MSIGANVFPKVNCVLVGVAAGFLVSGLGVTENFFGRGGEVGSKGCGRLRVRPRRLVVCPLDPSSSSSTANEFALLEGRFFGLFCGISNFFLSGDSNPYISALAVPAGCLIMTTSFSSGLGYGFFCSIVGGS